MTPYGLSDAEECSQTIHTFLLWSIILGYHSHLPRGEQIGNKWGAVMYGNRHVHSVGLAEHSSKTACMGWTVLAIRRKGWRAREFQGRSLFWEDKQLDESSTRSLRKQDVKVWRTLYLGLKLRPGKASDSRESLDQFASTGWATALINIVS